MGSLAVHRPVAGSRSRVPKRLSPVGARMKLDRLGSLDLHGVAEVGELADQTIGELLPVGGLEVLGTEIDVVGSVLKHVVGSSDDRSRPGHDGFLGTAASAQAKELGLEVTAADADRSPCRLNERGLEPGSAVAQPSRAALAGALVVPGTESGPRDEMSGGQETRHV